MRISKIIEALEAWAPPALQESYDNSGLIVGSPDWETNGVLVALDCIEAVVDEAIQQGIGLVVAHHPIVFSGLKRFNGKNYVERVVMKAIKHDVALYAIHTNLDNVSHGVNAALCAQLGLTPERILSPLKGQLKKFQVYVPQSHKDAVEAAVYAAGGGVVSKYEECSFATEGTGSFKPTEGTQPHIGTVGEREYVKEIKMEFIIHSHVVGAVLSATQQVHPYEEMAYEIIATENSGAMYGAGVVATLPAEMSMQDFAQHVKAQLGTTIKATPFSGESVKTVALCGGSGQFLLGAALASSAQVFITSDFKYHQYFDAEGRITVFDVGHFESEQFTIQLIADFIEKKFPKFAVLKTKVKTNPIQYI